MKMTSAYANKMLRQLAEEKEYWLNKEKNSCLYTAAVNEDPVIPDYDFTEVSDKIREIDTKMCRIKHAVNETNVNARIDVCGTQLSVDEILVMMAQLNQRKNMLDYMRKQLPKTRKENNGFSPRSAQAEYQYINYDLELVKKEFEQISQKIMNLQMELDKYNQTFAFEVEA